MKMVKEILKVAKEGYTEINGVGITENIYYAEKLLGEGLDTIKREDIKAYILGFNSNDIASNNHSYTTRQALLYKLKNELGDIDYVKLNKEKQKEMEDVIKYHAVFNDKVIENNNFTKYFKTETEAINYYIENGGEKDLWDYRSKSNSKYRKYFKYFDTGEGTFEQQVEQAKETGNNQELGELDDSTIKTIYASYYRNKRHQIREDIAKGLDKKEVLTKYKIYSKIYDRHKEEVEEDIRKQAKKYEGEDNLIQKVKYKLGFKTENNNYIKKVVDNK